MLKDNKCTDLIKKNEIVQAIDLVQNSVGNCVI